MKYYRYAILFLAIIFAVQNIQAQNRKFGLGIIVGDPTGLSGKLWTSQTNAFAFGIGWSTNDETFDRFNNSYFEREGHTHIHVDYLWHSFRAINSNSRFPLYYGIGGQINTGPAYNGTFALRGLLGIEWLPYETPIDIFFEVVPIFQLVNSTGFGIDAALGARFFF